MSPRFERLVSGVIAASAVAIAAAVVYRQLVPRAVPPAGTPISISYVENWRDLIQAGRQIGSHSAGVQVIEFVDLECPGCRVFARTLRKILDSYNGKVGAVLIHYPLEMHKNALPAARAAECAATEGRFGAIVDVILENRDSLSLGRWVEYAAASGVQDTAWFRDCQAATLTISTIEDGIAAGDRLGVRATPTVLVNGWRFSSVPVERELRQTIDEILDGKSPSLSVR